MCASFHAFPVVADINLAGRQDNDQSCAVHALRWLHRGNARCGMDQEQIRQRAQHRIQGTIRTACPQSESDNPAEQRKAIARIVCLLAPYRIARII
jgi:hypothetical protein